MILVTMIFLCCKVIYANEWWVISYGKGELRYVGLVHDVNAASGVCINIVGSTLSVCMFVWLEKEKKACVTVTRTFSQCYWHHSLLAYIHHWHVLEALWYRSWDITRDWLALAGTVIHCFLLFLLFFYLLVCEFYNIINVVLGDALSVALNY